MKKYKPLGSVVLLKNGTKRVMIYGRKQILASTGDYLIMWPAFIQKEI